MQCEMCGGELCYVGVLGNLNHLRCRDCGMMSYVEMVDKGISEIGIYHIPDEWGESILEEEM